MKAITKACGSSIILAGLLAAAGCATEPTAPAANAAQASAPQAKKVEGEVLTGSRIPRKGGTEQPVATVSGKEWERDMKSNVMTGPNPN